MLCPRPGEGTIHRLLQSSFLWLWACRGETHSKASYSPCWLLPPLHPFFFFLPPNDDREQLLQVMLWIFYGTFIFFGWEEEASARKSRFGWDGWVGVEGPGLMHENLSVIFNVLRSFDSAPLVCTVGDLSCCRRSQLTATCYMIHGQDINYWRLYQWTQRLHFDLLRLLYPVCQQCRNRGSLMNNLIPRQDVYGSNSVAPSEIEHFRQPQCYSFCFDKYILRFCYWMNSVDICNRSALLQLEFQFSP